LALLKDIEAHSLATHLNGPLLDGQRLFQ
jgi:hypothetical protein